MSTVSLRWIRHGACGLLAIAMLWPIAAAVAQDNSQASVRDRVDAVVGVRAEIPPEARTAGILGREREGSGVVIDASGLVLTIGYVILEADYVELFDAEGEVIIADIVAYDHESGFGLVRARTALATTPMPLGDPAALEGGDPALVVSRVDGELAFSPVTLADRRVFAGYWEYLLEAALFTAPAHRAFAGAALMDAQGSLIGIGSLFVGDPYGANRAHPGNMFIPVDELEPILADLLSEGRRSGAVRPWLGLQIDPSGPLLQTRRVSEDGPAASAGIRPGDIIVGVGGEPVRSLETYLRILWAQGVAGDPITLQILRGAEIVPIEIISGDRYDYLRLDPVY